MNSQAAWAIQLDKVYRGGKATCPICGNRHTEHKFCVFPDGVGYGDFYCPECGAKEHLCRMKFPEGIAVELHEVK